MIVNMWYGDNPTDCESVDILYVEKDGVGFYEGNCYNGEKIVGNYKCNDLLEIADTFTQFDWASYYRNIWIAEENM